MRQTQDEFDPKAYPRTYGLSVASKWMVSALGLVIASLSLAGAIFFAFGDTRGPPAGSAILVALSGGFALMGIYLLAVVIFYRVELQADSIQVFEIYRRRHLARSEIEGRGRFSYGQGMSAWVLVPKPGFGGKIKLSSLIKSDKDFLAWIRSLPDLDVGKQQDARKEQTAAVKSLKQRGFAELTIRRLRRVAGGLNFVVYGLGLASLIVNDQYHLLTWSMVALPWIAILLVGNFAPLYRFGGPRNSPLPDLSIGLIIPGLFLTLGALRSISPIGWVGPVCLAVFGSLLLVGAAFWCDPWLKNHRGTTVLLLLLCCSYGYGAGAELNALLDGSTARQYRVVVAGKYVSHGKSTSYHLNLAPWGPNPSGQNLMVPYSQYTQIKRGDTVCMSLRSGALRVMWSELGRCDRSD
jgi:hypothetical protein